MSLKPIDAQVLFSRINQLGKEQADQKDAQAHAQGVAGAQIARRSEEASHRVTAAQNAEDENAARQVKDEERRGARGRNASEEERKTGEEEAGEGGREEFVQEAYLGRTIDITG